MLLLCLASRSAHHLVLRSLTPVGLAACRAGATVVVPVVTGRTAAHAGWHAATFPADATDPPYRLERWGSGDRRGGHGRPRRRQGRVRSQQLAAWPRWLRPGRRPGRRAGRRAPGAGGAAVAGAGNPAGGARRPPPGPDHDHRRPAGLAGDRRRIGPLARPGVLHPQMVLVAAAGLAMVAQGLVRRRAWARWAAVVAFSLVGVTALAELVDWLLPLGQSRARGWGPVIADRVAVDLVTAVLFLAVSVGVIALLITPATRRDFRSSRQPPATTSSAVV